MPDFSVAIALLRKPIEAVASVATGSAREFLARMKADATLKVIHQKLNATQKVKTIWNVDRAIAINSFFYPANVRSGSRPAQRLTSPDQLESNHVVLEGIVGQGKSILLRFLLGREMRIGKRIPIFVELRRVQKAGLETHIAEHFNHLVDNWGVPELFRLFASEGKISLMLDGFDEVEPERTQEIASSIEQLAERYPKSRIIVSSRPGVGIGNSPLFETVQILPLGKDELPHFLGKILYKDKALAQRLWSAVSKVPSVEALASTPLLATLLTIVYRVHSKIPEDFAEFFDQVFQILLVRHDRSKSGYERKRRSKLADREIQQAFEAYCFKTKAVGSSSLQKGESLEYAAASLDAQKLNCSASDFLEDITKITCLLAEEGGRIEFLHQSVQEFFAARYVASRPEEVAKRFYDAAKFEGRWVQWDQVIRFLGVTIRPPPWMRRLRWSAKRLSAPSSSAAAHRYPG